MHTRSLLLEHAEDASTRWPGMNPIHLALVPGAPRVAVRPVREEESGTSSGRRPKAALT